MDPTASGAATRQPILVASFAAWASAARELLRHGVAPPAVQWVSCGGDEGLAPDAAGESLPPLPRPLLQLFRRAACCRIHDRWSLLYRVLWRWQHGEHGAASRFDPDGARLRAMAKAVLAEEHAMREQLRFHERPAAAGAPRFVGWCQPRHDVLALVARHYALCMRAVSWMIVTPSASVAWDGSRLRNTGPPASAGLPLPPAQVPDDPGHCRRCGLWEHATQAVPGVGPARARIMLVGEQPGDQEDLEGLPFVGPAGKLLERALAEAGLERRKLYLTNAVKHFKWELRGKRRIHKTPAQREVQACLHWLEAELARVAPRVVVALGAVALKALTGDPGATLQGAQGRPRRHGERWLVATYHPAYVLRMPDPEQRQRAFAALVESLREARRLQDT